MGEAEAQLQSRAFDVWLTAVHSRPGPGCMSHPPASEVSQVFNGFANGTSTGRCTGASSQRVHRMYGLDMTGRHGAAVVPDGFLRVLSWPSAIPHTLPRCFR